MSKPADQIDLKLFGRAVRMHRGRVGLRDAEFDSGVDHSTINRVEKGATPTLNTFLLLCKWMGMRPQAFMDEPMALSKREVAIESLTADRLLPEDTAAALVAMIEQSYKMSK